LLRNSNVKLIVNFRGFDLYQKNKLDYTPLFSEADLFLVRSNVMRKDLISRGCPNQKINIHHSSVDLKEFPFKERKIRKRQNIRFLSIGEFVETKGMRYTIDAFGLFVKEYPNAELTIVGDGVLKDRIMNQIKKLGLEKKIILKGLMSHCHICDEMHKHTVFILHSIIAQDGTSEGIPVVLMEAMATGMPVISTFHKGINELVDNGKNGLLTEEKNVRQLYEKMKYLYEKPELWARIGKYGRKKVETYFNIDIQTTKLEKIYSNLS